VIYLFKFDISYKTSFEYLKINLKTIMDVAEAQ